MKAEVKTLKNHSDVYVNQANQLGKYKDRVIGAEETIKQLSAEMAALEKRFAENHKLADLVLIEIKEVFATSLAKIQKPQDITQQPLPVNNQTEPRETIVANI